MSNPADRPATEPRTDAGRRLLAEQSFDSGLRSFILAIEAEAAQGAAPRRKERAWTHKEWLRMHRPPIMIPDRLANALAASSEKYGWSTHEFAWDQLAEFIAAEYNATEYAEGAAPRAEGLRLYTQEELDEAVRDALDEAAYGEDR